MARFYTYVGCTPEGQVCRQYKNVHITETFELIVFSHHEVREIARADGEEVRPEIGKPAAWKGLDRGTVERLLGQGV